MLALATLPAMGCGKKGPPLPIVHVTPSPPGPLRVRQIGTDVILASTLPGRRSDGTPLDPETELRVLRMPATDSLRPGAVSDRYLVMQFDKQARTVASLSGPALASLVLEGRLVFIDHDATGTGGDLAAGRPASPAGAGGASTASAIPTSAAPTTGTAPSGTGTQPAPRLPRYLYALQMVEPKGRKSPLRSPSMIEVCRAPEAPVDLQLETAEGEVRLDWKPGDAPARVAATQTTTPQTASPQTTVPQTTVPQATAPVFNVYRRQKTELRDPEAPLNPAPLDSPSFIDRAFQYDVEYIYFVRATTSDKNSTCESVAGPSVEVKPHDRFAPDAPTGLAVAAEGDVIRVYWFPNSEPDLGGYRVYRREGGASETSFLADVPPTETSFIDSGAKRGVRYHYSVSAVDTATPVNESARSEERTEMLSVAPAGGSPGNGTPQGGR